MAKIVRVKPNESSPWLERELDSFGFIKGRFFVRVKDDSRILPITVFEELVHPDNAAELKAELAKE